MIKRETAAGEADGAVHRKERSTLRGRHARRPAFCLVALAATVPLAGCDFLSPSRQEIEDTVHREITGYYHVEMANCSELPKHGWDCYVTFVQLPDKPRVDGLRIHFVRRDDDALSVEEWEPFG